MTDNFIDRNGVQDFTDDNGITLFVDDAAVYLGIGDPGDTPPPPMDTTRYIVFLP